MSVSTKTAKSHRDSHCTGRPWWDFLQGYVPCHHVPMPRCQNIHNISVHTYTQHRTPPSTTTSPVHTQTAPPTPGTVVHKRATWGCGKRATSSAVSPTQGHHSVIGCYTENRPFGEPTKGSMGKATPNRDKNDQPHQPSFFSVTIMPSSLLYWSPGAGHTCTAGARTTLSVRVSPPSPRKQTAPHNLRHCDHPIYYLWVCTLLQEASHIQCSQYHVQICQKVLQMCCAMKCSQPSTHFCISTHTCTHMHTHARMVQHTPPPQIKQTKSNRQSPIHPPRAL